MNPLPAHSLSAARVFVTAIRILLFGSVVGLFSGCVVAERPARAYRAPVVVEAAPPPSTVVVEPAPAEALVLVPPPPPRREVIIERPSPRHVWIAGYWVWRDGRHVWVAGHWEVPPRGYVAWVAPRWELRHGGYVFIAGHWR